MNLFFALMVLVSLSSAVLGDREYELASIRKSYKNLAEMDKIYLDMLNKVQDEQNPCYSAAQTHPGLKPITSDLFYESAIIKGDFNDITGYRVILDDFTTVDVPVLLRCIPKCRDGSILRLNNKEFIYTLLLYKVDSGLKYDLVYPSERTENSRPLFLLGKAIIIEEILNTYKINDDDRKKLRNSFVNLQKILNATSKCQDLVGKNLIKVGYNDSWEILNGSIELGKFQLRVTKMTQVRIPGVVKCDIKMISNGGENANKESKVRSYFTVSRIDQLQKIQGSVEDAGRYSQKINFVKIYGSTTSKSPKIFALYPELL